MSDALKASDHLSDGPRWQFPIDFTKYDRTPQFHIHEQQALEGLVAAFDAKKTKWPPGIEAALERLVVPMQDVIDYVAYSERHRASAIRLMIRYMQRFQSSYWAWSSREWEVVLTHEAKRSRVQLARPVLLCIAYLLGGLREFPTAYQFERIEFATRIFGEKRVEQAIEPIVNVLLSWGYDGINTPIFVKRILPEFLLVSGSPYLKDIPVDILARVNPDKLPKHLPRTTRNISRALLHLGILDEPLQVPGAPTGTHLPETHRGISPEWINWIERWAKTVSLSPGSIDRGYYVLLKVGRWLAEAHPEINSPADWTREIAIEFKGIVNHLTVGDYVSVEKHGRGIAGAPLSGATKIRHLQATSSFFQACQEWGWIPVRFRPERCLAPSRSLRAQKSPRPRVIEDALWAKLIWAGLNLEPEDLYSVQERTYPFELIRALAVTWLFSGLRVDEIRRLPIGCVRWQPDLQAEGHLICFLDVPEHKTGPAFTKPIAQLAGKEIEQWQQLRPDQPPKVDRKSRALTHYLFMYRGKRVGRDYLNETVIPMLCQKAGTPQEDTRGRITSHRARATIASQLANAREPMTLLELQQWLGHRTPFSTQHYVKSSPNQLARAYAEAGYLDRNIRAIQVLVDQDMIRSGAVTNGEAWKYYDVGHGHCSYDFFDRCPHRMACAKCDFYLPKDSAKAQLLEAKKHLLRMKQEIPLLDDEVAALEEDLAAVERLCERLVDVPTPSGPTPRELETGRKSFIPLNEIG